MKRANTQLFKPLIIEQIDDTRTFDEKVGNITTPKRKRLPKDQQEVVPAMTSGGKEVAIPQAEMKKREKEIKALYHMKGVESLDAARIETFNLMNNSPNEIVRLQAAKDIQDRFGGKATNKNENETHAPVVPIFNIIGGNFQPNQQILDGIVTANDEDE